VPPITIDSTEEQIRQAVATARVGRKLTPKAWPNGARVAVCLTFDVDNELLQRANPLPVPLSVGETGNDGAPRILDLLDRRRVPGRSSFLRWAPYSTGRAVVDPGATQS
jgi:hypothetical protein